MKVTRLLLAAVLLMPLRVAAQTPPIPQDQPVSHTPVEVEVQAAWRAAQPSAIRGPAQIKLLDQGSLRLTADEVFIPAAPANRIMAAMGNSTGPSRFGLIVSRRPDADWLIDIDWTREGYVRDGAARDWQADALFDSLKESTQAANARRLARGIPALDLIGWVQPPTYDARQHRLVWSLSARERGGPAGAPQTVNYNTYALGREGYFSLDLVTDARAIATDKQAALDLLGTLQFAPGKRYQDFDGSTDKVAAYGIAALVGAVAVKKVGLLAVIGVFLLKVWKLGLLALAGVSAAARRLFGRGRPGDGQG